MGPGRFEASLATRRDERFVGPLTHLVAHDAPAGVVQGIATLAPAAPAPAATVQRATTRRFGPAVRGAAQAWGDEPVAASALDVHALAAEQPAPPMPTLTSASATGLPHLHLPAVAPVQRRADSATGSARPTEPEPASDAVPDGEPPEAFAASVSSGGVGEHFVPAAPPVTQLRRPDAHTPVANEAVPSVGRELRSVQRRRAGLGAPLPAKAAPVQRSASVPTSPAQRPRPATAVHDQIDTAVRRAPSPEASETPQDSPASDSSPPALVDVALLAQRSPEPPPTTPAPPTEPAGPGSSSAEEPHAAVRATAIPRSVGARVKPIETASTSRSASSLSLETPALGDRPSAIGAVQRAADVPSIVLAAVEAETGTVPHGAVVHRDEGVSRSATAMGARAFTADGEVHLPAHHGVLESAEAAPLLAHELVHVVQQRKMGALTPPETTGEGVRLEQQARAAEQRVVQRATAQRAAIAERAVSRYRTVAQRAASSPTARTDAGSIALATGIGRPGPDGSVVFSPPAEASTPGGAEPVSAPASASVPAPVQRAAEEPSSAPPSLEHAGETSSAAPTSAPATTAAGKDLDELARRLYPRLRDHLRADLRLGRERAGRVTDLGLRQ